jgi:hypothetical protein
VEKDPSVKVEELDVLSLQNLLRDDAIFSGNVRFAKLGQIRFPSFFVDCPIYHFSNIENWWGLTIQILYTILSMASKFKKGTFY